MNFDVFMFLLAYLLVLFLASLEKLDIKAANYLLRNSLKLCYTELFIKRVSRREFGENFGFAAVLGFLLL